MLRLVHAVDFLARVEERIPRAREVVPAAAQLVGIEASFLDAGVWLTRCPVARWVGGTCILVEERDALVVSALTRRPKAWVPAAGRVLIARHLRRVSAGARLFDACGANHLTDGVSSTARPIAVQRA